MPTKLNNIILMATHTEAQKKCQTPSTIVRQAHRCRIKGI